MKETGITLAFGIHGVITWPVEVMVPKTSGSDPNKNTHTRVVCYVNYEFLSDTCIQELLDNSEKLSSNLLKSSEKERSATSEKELREAKKEKEKAEKEFRSWRSILLERVVVGFPENHGWGKIFTDLPEFSPNLIREMASFRPIGKALEDAYWKMIDPPK